MVLKLDPRWPLVWRDPHTVQFGVDLPRAVVERVTSAQERMIAALVAGVPRSGLELFAAPDEVDELLERLMPALDEGADPPAAAAVHGTGPTAEKLLALLAPAASPVVIVAHHVVSPDLHGRWLSHDLPHLPVVYGDSLVHIGPFIEPGTGPCLFCLELHRTDADPAWPAIASQLLGRHAGTETPLIAVEVAAIVTRLVARRAADGPGAAWSVELEVSTGRTSERVWARHPDCQCGGLRTAVPPRTGTASVRPPDPIRFSPRTAATAAEPA
jgi:bacteriocin biosynthesis cyclodehydratase domain-containing protein